MAVLQDLLDAYRWRRWPRRALVTGLLFAAALAALTPRPPTRMAALATRPVAVARHPLSAGQAVRTADVRLARWPTELVPDGAAARVGDVIGRRVAGPVAGGEAITRLRLVGPGLTTGLPPGEVAVPVLVDGRAGAGFLHAGDHVDLYAAPVDATGAASGPPTRSAVDLLVLAVLPETADAPDPGGGVELVLALDDSETRRVVAAQSGTLVAVVRAPP